MGCFKSKKEFKINFLEFLSIFSLFQTKSGKKTRFFVIFSKIMIFGQNLTLSMCSL